MVKYIKFIRESVFLRLKNITYCNLKVTMLERGNKFKPISKKEVPLPINTDEETTITQASRLSSNSQNKLFIRKPVTKRNGFISPNFTKNRGLDNEEVKSPIYQTKSKKCMQSDSHSEQDYWDSRDSIQVSTKLTLKKYISTQQSQKTQIVEQSNICDVSEAYFGNENHALTQIGENYKVQMIESDNSQKDLYFNQNLRRNSKQNIVANPRNINTKKVTRTEYFTNPDTEEIRSTTSSSLKQKQLNFSLLRQSVNNNIEAYIFSLEDTIRKLEKNNYTLNKKCKWMHEEVQMHLQKDHLIIAEKKTFQLEIKNKQNQIQRLIQENSNIKKQLDELKLQLQNKEPLKKCKSFKDLETISSMKQLCFKKQERTFGKVSKMQGKFQGYFGIVPSSIQKNKMKSFRTYPGICSPRKSRQVDSKCSSMIGNNESFQDSAQSSVLNEKSNVKNKQIQTKYEAMIEDLKKQRDQLKVSLEFLTAQITALKEKNLESLSQNKEYEKKLYSQLKNYDQLKSQFDTLLSEKEMLLVELDKIHSNYQAQILSFTTKIKDLESQAFIQGKSQVSSVDTVFQEENPLKYLLEHTEKNKNFGDLSDIQGLEHENKSLRIYIQKIMEHYKYIKIQNRMLLKVKEEKEKLEKEKKQIKDQRDSFKKKLLDILKNKSQTIKQPTKSFRKLIDLGSDSSQEEDSAVFELSQSEIKIHDQSKYEKTQN